MLMHAYRSAVDHLHIAVVGLADGGHDVVPDAGFAPPHKAVVAGRVRPELLWQGPPRCPRTQYPEDAVPDAGFAPPHKAGVAGRVRPELRWQGPPRCPRTQYPEDAVQDPPVVHPRHPARLVRQQWLDHLPFEIRQLVPLHDPAPSVGKLESHLDSHGNPFYEFM